MTKRELRRVKKSIEKYNENRTIIFQHINGSNYIELTDKINDPNIISKSIELVDEEQDIKYHFYVEAQSKEKLKGFIYYFSIIQTKSLIETLKLVPENLHSFFNNILDIVEKGIKADNLALEKENQKSPKNLLIKSRL